MATATSLSLQCNRKALLNAFGTVSSCVPTRSPKPILQNVKLTTGFSGITTLQATDLEVGIRCEVEAATPKGTGDLILPTGKISQILKSSKDETIRITSDGDNLTVRGDRNKFVLPSEDPDLFPEIPDFPSGGYYSVAASELRKLVRRTSFAVDLESVRYALGGAQLEFEDGTLIAVGTDGRRLAKAITLAEAFDGAAPPKLPPVVPLKALKLLERALDDDDDQVLVTQTDQAIYFRSRSWTIYSRLVEGRFPVYRNVFPSGVSQVIPVAVGSLKVAVEQASIVTSEESQGVVFRFASDLLSLSSQAPDAGSSTVELPIEYSGPMIEVTLDPQYLLDALKILDESANISIELIDAKNAVLFKTDDQYIYVVMPLTGGRG